MPVLDNGRITLQDGKEVTDVVPAGSAVMFSCNIGFTLYGHRELTCTTSGKLNDTTPNCTGMYENSKKILNETHFIMLITCSSAITDNDQS